MLMFAFFASVFASVSWVIYAALFIRMNLGESTLWEQTPEALMTDIALIFLPVLVVWAVFGYVNQFLNNRSMNRKQTELLTQLQKNQDYTDLVVRVMLEAEHEIKDGFVLNKFEVFINDMNEALSEVIQRCNIASSAQLEQLWQRVKRGEKWTLGKAVLEASKNQSTFNAWVSERVGRDKVFRGALVEFCSHYQKLIQLLEKHDRDRIFIRMVESGVFGKVYSIIAPLSEGIQNSATSADLYSEKTATTKTNEYETVLKLATMNEPKIEESIVNVDKDDTESEDNEDLFEDEHEISAPRKSFLSRLNPFKRTDDDYLSREDDDPFFQALQNSFQGHENEEPVFSTADDDDVSDEPHLNEMDFANDEVKNHISESNFASETNTSFSNIENTLNNLRASREETPSFEPVNDKSEQGDEDEEDLIYPFGGWTDENNYSK